MAGTPFAHKIHPQKSNELDHFLFKLNIILYLYYCNIQAYDTLLRGHFSFKDI